MRGKYYTWLLLPAMGLLPAAAQTGFTPVIYGTAGTSYTQNFDGLPATGSFSLTGKGPLAFTTAPINAASLPGWQLWMMAGSNANAVFATGSGSATGNGVYSLGNNGSTDRALGTLSSSTGTYALGLLLTNQTGNLLNSFTLRFTAEQWRKGGSTNPNTWTFHYKTGPITQLDEDSLRDESRLNFSSVNSSAAGSSLNGNLTENQQVVSFTVTGINWKNGEQLLLRWDDADETGSDDIMALDDFQFSASLQSNKPQVSNAAADSITAGSVFLSAFINDNAAATAIRLQYDTLPTLVTASTIHPVPDTLTAGSGNSSATVRLSGLLSGRSYYYRFIATNSKGADSSSIRSFTTTISPPTVTTTLPTGVGTQTAVCGGHVTSQGGASVTERGLVWKMGSLPERTDNRIQLGSGIGSFTTGISSLPQGAAIYVRAYAINSGGLVYGNPELFRTKNTVLALNRTGNRSTRAATVSFRLQTAVPATTLGLTDFSVTANGVTGASVTSVTANSAGITVTVSTGNGDGRLSISFTNDSSTAIPFSNTPFAATDYYDVDKTAPQVKQVTIPDNTSKIGDTIPLTIHLAADTTVLILGAGNMVGMPLTGFARTNDSLYRANCIVTADTKDIGTSDSLPLTLSVTDAAGNTGLYQATIRRQTGRIDRTRPAVTSMEFPRKGTYKAGDTLRFIARFSEKVNVSGGIPYLAVTVGTRSRMALYTGGSGSDSLLFTYIIQNGEKDGDGIKTAGNLTAGSALVADSSGNIASYGFNNSLPTNTVLVDAVLPTVTAVLAQTALVYTTGQHLDLTVQFSKKCWVSNTATAAFLNLTMGNKTRPAYYLRGSGSQWLSFRYTIQENDRAADGIKLISPLSNNGPSIRDSAGNPVDTELHNITPLGSVRINPPTAELTELKISEDRIYATGDSIGLVTKYSETVFVSGTTSLPYLTITIGKTNRKAYYARGSGTTELLFIYQVQAGEEDTDGISVAGSISLNGNTILDEKGYPAPLDFTPVTNRAKSPVDAVAPSIKTIDLPASRLYGSKDSLTFLFNFSKPVLVPEKDTVFLVLVIGSKQRKLAHRRNQDPHQLCFNYTIQPGDLDKNGISIGTSLLADASSIRDLTGNKAVLTFAAAMAVGIKIDALPPVFLSRTDSLFICENNAPVSLSASLTLYDEETAELINGDIQGGSKNAAISVKNFTITSTGKNNSPAGITYSPPPAATGTDTLTVTISDGINSAQKIIYIFISPRIRNNQVSAPAVICADKKAPLVQGTTPSGGNGQYLYSWEISTSPEPVSFGNAAGSYQSMHYQPATLAATSWFRRKVLSGGCMDSSQPRKTIVLTNGVWLGNNNNWQDTANWCGSVVPTSATDVFIDASVLYQPQIHAVASCRQLIIPAGASLRIEGILQLYGNLEAGPEQLQAEAGTLVFSGSSQQYVSGKPFRRASISNLLLNNPYGLVVTDPLFISGWLKLNAGKLQTQNQLRLKENAIIRPSAAATAIEGAVTATALIKGGRRSFQLLAHPFSHPIGLYMIKDSIDITGEGGSQRGFTPTPTNAPSAFYFDHRNATDSTGIEAGWLPFTDTNGKEENAWEPMQGIRVLTRGKPGQGLDGTPPGDGSNGTYLPLPVRLQYTGETRIGDREKTLPATIYEHYHSIGNPYLAPIDLSRVGRTAGISRHYWLWHPFQGKQGGYTSYPFTIKNTLPPFGSFVVTTYANTAQQLLFTENSKSADPAPDSVPFIQTDDWYHVELRLETDTIFWDRILLVQQDSARWGIDRNDAAKLLNPDVNFYSLLPNGKKLSIDARPFDNGSTIALGMESQQPQTFRIRVSAASLPPTNTLLLHDKWLNRWMPLVQDSIYAFVVTNDTVTQGNQRFEITSRKKIIDSSNREKIKIDMRPVPVSSQLQVSFVATEKGNTTVRILSLSGNPLKTVSLGMAKEGKVQIGVADLFSGLYLLELRCGSQVSSRKFIKD